MRNGGNTLVTLNFDGGALSHPLWSFSVVYSSALLSGKHLRASLISGNRTRHQDDSIWARKEDAETNAKKIKKNIFNHFTRQFGETDKI